MAKFIFRLNTVLNLKLKMEDNLKNELAKAVDRLNVEKRKLEKLQEERKETSDNMNLDCSRGICVLKLKEYSIYLSFLSQKEKIQKENIKLAEKDVDRYRVELIKLVKERQSLEKLKEKKYLEYQKEELKKEQGIIDEIISFKYSKPKKEN